MTEVTGNFVLKTFFVVARQRYKMKMMICVLHQKNVFHEIFLKAVSH